MSKTYDFEIEMNNIGRGYVTADSLEEAISKIKSGDYDDIYDERFLEFGELIEIREGDD